MWEPAAAAGCTPQLLALSQNSYPALRDCLSFSSAGIHISIFSKELRTNQLTSGPLSHRRASGQVLPFQGANASPVCCCHCRRLLSNTDHLLLLLLLLPAQHATPSQLAALLLLRLSALRLLLLLLLLPALTQLLLSSCKFKRQRKHLPCSWCC
jgi:hypothetical protein